MTEDAEPTMTSPMRQSRTTSRSSSVETETPVAADADAEARAAGGLAVRRASVGRVDASVALAGARRGRGDVCRSGGAMLRVDVMTPAPSGRGRAALPGPTPDA